MTTPIITGTIPLDLRKPDTSSVSTAVEGFSDILSDTIKQVNNKQVEANSAINKLQTGEAESLHNVMIAMEEADLSLRMLVQMRNKAQEAYDTIMRLQV